jgi:DNA polymerase III epsilon subunit-like protein
MIKLFSAAWATVPVVFLDTETTGTNPATDRAVQVGVARFEGGKCVGEFCSIVNPGRLIPTEATEIHGITDAMCADAPTIADVFASTEVTSLLQDAQPGAYNQNFDRLFVPPFGEAWAWPWVDSLSFVRVVDRWVKGSGRHKLAVTAARHGIAMNGAHDALVDAKACGEIFFKLAPSQFKPEVTMGELLRWQRVQEAESWFDFHSWLAKQPPREVA